MKKSNDQKSLEFVDKGRDFSKSVHNWLAQYDEEDDFLSGKISAPLTDSLREE